MDRFFLATNPLKNGSAEYVIDNLKGIYYLVEEGKLIHAPMAKVVNIRGSVLDDAETIISSYKQAERWYRAVREQRLKK